MTISNQIINNLVNLSVSSSEFKKNFEKANLETLLLTLKENISETKRAMIDAKVNRLTENKSFDFENNMTEDEAHNKHAQLKSLHSVARALLLEIRDRKGYLALGFSSFEEYGEKEWGYSRSYIYRIAQAEEIQQTISRQIGDKEIPENQLRPLGKIPKAARDEIYQKAKAEAEAEGKAVTAKAINEAVTVYLEKLNAAQTTIFALEKQVKAKEDVEKELEHLKNIHQHQSKDVDTVIKVHSKLVYDFNELEATVDTKAQKLADEQLAAKQAEMQKQLDNTLINLEADYQAKIDSQKDVIARLQNTIDKIAQTSATTDQDTTYLADLKQEIDEAKAALKQLSLDEKEANATKRVNHAYTGIAKALSSDVHDHIENMNSISSLVDNNGNAIPLYQLTDDSKDYLQEVARVLRNSAKFLDNLANYTDNATDGVDEAYQSMEGFFTHWKIFRNALYKPQESNDYECWLSWLKQDKDESLNNCMIEMFPKIWERYQFEIQAIN